MRTATDHAQQVIRRPVLPDWFSVVALVAAVVGSWLAYGRTDLTLDEGYTSAETRLPFGTLWGVIWSRELNGSLHTLLMWSFDRPEPVVLRLTSTMFMVAAIVLLHRCVSRIFGPWPAFVALVVAAGNPAIQQDLVYGRTYAMSLLLLMVSFVLLETAVRNGGTLRFIAWGGFCGLMLYAHFLTGLVVAGQVLWLLLFHRRQLRQWVAGLGAGVVLCVPIGFFLVSGGGSRGQLVSTSSPTLSDMVGGLLEVMAGYGRAAPATQAVVVLLVVGVVALGLTADTHRVAALGLLTFAVPVLTLALGSQFAPSLFSERYLVFAVPGMAIGIGAGIGGCIDRSARLTLVTTTLLVAFSVVCALLVTGSLASTTWTQRHPWSAAMQTIGTGQRITTSVPAEGYLARLYADQRGAVFVPGVPETAVAFLEQSSYVDRTCAGFTRSTSPFWVISTMSPDFAAASSGLARCSNSQPDDTRTYGSVRLVELVPMG